ncbi:MAG: hypothetical protein ACTHV2_00035 [Brachybacterium sp.]|uniref:hypothetical protein n=1 Tax=Brachybacterium sp. TaxID=1891286 RepID=UPI002655AD72|nr:hypothetical protein [Brachybacterium sp.]MDN6301828.1 hypothetical protein [Brachybacterium sp.]MDN6327775.1 hypothetical protein [Brachybacterium sp.]MDN6399557.1 hypothetical protein [Brachybacterium sp.]
MTPAPSPSGSARGVDTDSLAARFAQAAMAIVLAIISVLLMLTTHRMEVALLGVDVPAGMLFGAAFQVVTCVFLWSATGSRFPLLVLGCLWGMLATPFLGESVGGGVLLPAMIGDVPQLSGWVIQGLGLAIPFLAAAVITVAGTFARRAR